ncbi:hypothetical protein CEK00_09735 [Stenotrophomonas maltophilia]|uniref:Fimbrial-type adhesion domain-containing protein n=2 Tax=Stenotrophomonas maltophilia TaxID=40324 RepID=A0A270MXS9_STEMA|nr:hypothetical protein CEK00_22000 [Stenotrophomonas maltophilia]PAM71850.1 hypothetical protein CEK00_09680 [Stenotrophomonas maltophilia]PAM71859.1 hypothetical protein CEK00_09735 [Stenotrophomonas maltophilia]
MKRIEMRVVMYSRGGLMTNVPFTTLGTVTVAPPQYPSSSTTFTVQVEAAFQERTCVITDPPTIVLGDIRRQDLPTIGSTAADQDFDVEFSCNGPRFYLRMTLADANDPGNTSSRLVPSSGSTAQGVRVELLRAGAPVSFGQLWGHGFSTGSSEQVTLTARYYREAGTFSSGTVEGQATLLMDYE